MAEPHRDRPDAGPDHRPEQISDEVAALSELTAAGVEVDGQVQVTESTWVVYGHTSYDGEIVVGEYHSAAEAAQVLRSAPPPPPDPDEPVP